jgi:predicted nicotinamide N-methyase
MSISSNNRYKHLRSHLEEHPLACKCFETLEESDDDTIHPGGTIIRFHCVLPPPKPATANNQQESPTTCMFLSFDCRAPSCGALKLEDDRVSNVELKESHVVDEWNALEDNVMALDPHLFDVGYTLAGRTGFQVWAGARLLLEYCLAQPQRDKLSGQRIVELGAGVGLVGTALAVHLARVQVLLTDLPTLVEYSLAPNLQRNHELCGGAMATTTTVHPSNTLLPPTWLVQAASSSSSPVVSFGSSWVGTGRLDWTRPVAEQLSLPDDDCSPAVDLILASDCVWLVSMLDSLLDTADALMGKDTKLWLSLQKREAEESSTPSSSSVSLLPSPPSSSCRMFTTIESILAAITTRSWHWTCVAWRPLLLVDGQESESFVFEISKNEKR